MDIKERLSQLRSCHLLVNYGNKGDGLIWQGCLSLLKELNIKVIQVFGEQDIFGDVLLVLGNGCFCKAYHHRMDAVNFYKDRFNKLIILPSTFEDVPLITDWVASLPDNVEVWCREETSFDIVSRYRQANLDHDLAFHIDYSEFDKVGDGVLCAWRTDSEQAEHPEIEGVVLDVSNNGDCHGWKDVLNVVGNFNVIHTNRCHAAIAGAMLEKEVHLYPNSYHKNKSIYEYSLKERGVEWQNV